MTDDKRDLTLHLLDILREADGPASDAKTDDYEFEIDDYPFLEIHGMLDLQHLAGEMLLYVEEKGYAWT